MATPLTRYLRDISSAHLAALTDGQLLQRFADQRDEAAFAALVRRHGPLVLGACRRVLRDWHAAEDAFQATFLVLARRAGSVRRPEALGPWLYGVASRTARKARAKEARRQECERRAGMALAAQKPDGLVWSDLRPALDDAVARLPDKYRVAFVLHHLQGLAVSEVARRLGCPQGTAAARLARAKVRLRGRLARQGLAMSAGALATALSKGVASAAVPAALSTVTVEAAIRFAAGNAVGAFSAAAVLTRGGLKTMSLSKVKVGLAVLLTVTAFGVGVSASRLGRAGRSQAGAELASKPGAREENGGRRPFERFYAGGFQSLRGFAFRGVGPDINGFAVGGDFMFLNSIEYQVPVRADDQLYFVPFLDTGTVEKTVSIHDYRVTAGSGLRITVPMLGPAPVALDFGFPVVKEAQEREQVFSFWVGLFS